MRWLIAFICAAQAGAACPTSADLPGGIRAVESDGVAHVFRAFSPDIVAVDVDFGEGETAKNQLLHGVYVKRLSTFSDGVMDLQSVIEFRYDSPVVPVPFAGMTQTLTTSVTDVDGSLPEVQSQVWGAAQTVQIGVCSFDAVEGQITYRSKVDQFDETVLFLPGVGIGLLTGYAVAGEPPDTYQFVRLEAMK